jgi:hypothetical protein
MKKINVFAHKLAAGALALAVITIAAQASADSIPQIAKILRVKGSARYSTDGRTWQPLHKGDILNPGVVLQTAEGSTIDLQMSDRDTASVSLGGVTSASASRATATSFQTEGEASANVVHIFPSSELSVDKLMLERTGVDEVSETQLDLRAGQIMGNVKKLSAASKYEVKIPNGVAGIRGTIYWLSSTSKASVVTGSIVLAIVKPDGTVVTKIVNAKYTYDPDTDTIRLMHSDELDQLVAMSADVTPIGIVTAGTTTGPASILWISPLRAGSAPVSTGD